MFSSKMTTRCLMGVVVAAEADDWASKRQGFRVRLREASARSAEHFCIEMSFSVCNERNVEHFCCTKVKSRPFAYSILVPRLKPQISRGFHLSFTEHP